jgi:hypothetical protein
MRFVGLEDAGSAVYSTYRTPDPYAPYPQDYIIDPGGVVRHWSTEYEPLEVIAVIDELLGATPITESPTVASGPWLSTPSPNPFLEGTTFRFGVPLRGRARVTVHDIGGRRLRVLADGTWSAGVHRVTWDGRDASGRRAAPGVYYVRLETDRETRTTRATRLR